MIRQIEYIHGTGRRAGSQIPKDIICALNVDRGLITGRITKSFQRENISELAGIHGKISYGCWQVIVRKTNASIEVTYMRLRLKK